MGMNRNKLSKFALTRLLHDVGTLSIPADLIDKTGVLDEREREILNQHAVLGAQLLDPSVL